MLFQLANLFMRGVSLLGADGDYKADWSWIDKVDAGVRTILVPIISILGAAGVIWAIVLGVNMARADSTEKREEAKKRLISLIVGIVIMVALIVFFLVGFKPLLNAFTKGGGVDLDKDPSNPGRTDGVVKSFLQLTNLM